MKKFSILIIIIVLAIAGLWKIAFQAGYDSRRAEELKDFKEQLKSVNKSAEDKIAQAVHERDHFKKKAILIEEQGPVYVTKTITKIVKENVIVGSVGCSRIAGFDKLLNEASTRFSDN